MPAISLESAVVAIEARVSELTISAQAVAKRPDNVLGLLLRELTREEIAVLEHQGCRSEDWSQVQVAADFDPFRVRHSRFVGSCVLGRFSGEKRVISGQSLPCGIDNCTIQDCQIGNDCLLQDVRYMVSTIVEHEAVVFDVGSITCVGPTLFGAGSDIGVACEVGGREVPALPELLLDEAAAIARERGDTANQERLATYLDNFREQTASDVAWIKRGALVRHTDRLRNCYIGTSAIIDHAQELRDCTVLSSPDEVTRISGGSTLTNSVIQWGVRVAGSAHVRSSMLLEHSHVDVGGMVEESIIGPNTGIEKGEVTASLLGPFVGFHHQSLLIAAYWPEGRGNIAYGAMVGSNHTSRAPDQEIWPGEGVFFGLGCSVRFPANFQESPYSVISAGVAVLPQRVSFPFSLIATPTEALADDDSIPRAFNELIPGWGLSHNAYSMVRMEEKLEKRDEATRHSFQYHTLRPDNVPLLIDALARLESVGEIKDIYLETDIPGIGKNFMRESARQEAIVAYRRALKRYCLRVLLAEAEGHRQLAGATQTAQRIARELMPNMSLAERLQELVAIEKENAEIVETSKASDDRRGAHVIPGMPMPMWRLVMTRLWPKRAVVYKPQQLVCRRYSIINLNSAFGSIFCVGKNLIYTSKLLAFAALNLLPTAKLRCQLGACLP